MKKGLLVLATFIVCFTTTALAQAVPIVNFTASKTTICVGDDITFTSSSTNNPTSFNWTFNGANNTSSTLQNPTISYSSPGVYSVTLIVENSIGKTTNNKSNLITVLPTFSIKLDSCLETYQIIGNGFGLLKVEIPGKLNISSGSAGQVGSKYTDNTGFCQNVSVLELNQTSTLNITTVTNGNLNQAIAFIDYNNNGAFESNEKILSSINIPQSTGLASAVFTVPANAVTGKFLRMRVISGKTISGQLLTSSCQAFEAGETEDYSVFINENSNLDPIAQFSVNRTSVCVNEEVAFTNLSTNGPESFSWNLNGSDKPTTNEVNPIIKYAIPGVYSATLEASKGLRTNFVTKTNLITVLPLFNMERSNCLETYQIIGNGFGLLKVEIPGKLNISSGSAGQVGSTYTDNTGSCQNVTVLELNQTSTLNITTVANGNENQAIAFIDYNNNGAFESDEKILSSILPAQFSGTSLASAAFTVPANAITGKFLRMRVIAGKTISGQVLTSSCQAFEAGETEDYSIFINATTTTIAPVANFSASKEIVCVGEKINLIDISTNSPTSWNWTAIDATPSSSTLQNPTFSYAKAGVFNIKLRAENSNGFTEITKPITVNALPEALTGGANQICGGGEIPLVVSPIPSDKTIDWYSTNTGGAILEGGEGTNTFTTPFIQVTTPFFVETRDKSTGCVSSSRKAIDAIVHPLPINTQRIIEDEACGPLASLVIGIERAANPSQQEQPFLLNPDHTIDWYASATGGNVLPNGLGTFDFTTPELAVSTIFFAEIRMKTTGCVSELRTAVRATVLPVPIIDLKDKTICSESTTTFDAGPGFTDFFDPNTFQSIPGYQWSNQGIGQLQTTDASIPGTYTVTVTNDKGCQNTASAILTIGTNLDVNLGPDTTICGTGSITLDAKNTGSTYEWNTGAITQTITTSTPDTFFVKVTDPTGCIGSDSIIIKSSPNPIVTLTSKSICGGVTSFDAGAGFKTYKWTDLGTGTEQTTSASKAGTYTVTVTNESGCSNTASATLSITPSVFVNLGPNQSVCSGESATFDAGNPGATYLWNTGEKTKTISPKIAGTFFVQVTDAKGCQANDTIVLTVNALPVVTLLPKSTCPGVSTFFDAGPGFLAYAWSDKGNGNLQTTDALTEGIYTVTVTNTNFCSASASASLSILPTPIISLTPKTICPGTSTTFDAGNPGATFVWSGLGTGNLQTTNATLPGFYTVQVTGANTCSASASTTLAFGTALSVDLGKDKSICTGDSTTIDAGNPDSKYEWNTGAKTKTISTKIAGTFFVKVTDASGCIGNDTVIITVKSLPIVTIAPKAICAGTTTTFDAGPGFASYVWSGLGTGTLQKTDATAAGTYTATVIDANGCTGSGSTTLTLNALPVISTESQTICKGDSVNFDAGNVGSTFVWSGLGTGFKQTTPATLAGAYTVKVTNANLCFTSKSVNLIVKAPPVFSIADKAICLGTTTTFDAGSGFVKYVWSGLGTGTEQTTPANAAGVYTVTVTNANVCSATTSATLSFKALPTVTLTDKSICQGTSTTFDAGNTGATFVWSGLGTGTAQTTNASESGTYTVDVTKDGCTSSASANLTFGTALSVDLGKDKSICTGNSTTLNAGNPGATYKWNTGATTQTISTNIAGTFSVIVTDPSGCIGNDTVIITVKPLPIVTIAPKAICAGTTTTFDAGPGFSSYTWSGLGTGTLQKTDATAAGTYTATVIDANGCTGSGSATLTLNTLPVVNITGKSICLDDSTTFDAGNTGSKFEWSGLGTGTAQTTKAKIAGTYTVKVTNNANECFVSKSAILTVKASPILNIPNKSICAGSTSTFDAGAGFDTYAWSGLGTGSAQTTPTSTAGTYSVTVTAAGCSASKSATLTFGTSLSVNLGADKSICSSNPVTLDAGNTGSTYLWNTGATTKTITTSSSGNFSVIVTDGNGCIGKDTIVINLSSNPDVSLSNKSICVGTSTTFDAGAGFTSYVWSGFGTGTIQTTTANTAGNYTVVVTNANGCKDTATATLTVNSAPIVSIGNQTRTICQGNSTTFDAGAGFSSYAWSGQGSGNAQTFIATLPGTYTVTVTNANTCSAIASATLTVNATLDIDRVLNLKNQTICQGSSAAFAVAEGFASYVWSGAGTGNTFLILDNSTPGVYTCTATDANGCTGTKSATLTVLDSPVLNIPTKSICKGISTIFDAGNPGSTFEWSGLGTGTSQTTVANTAGEYFVTVTNPSGCKKTVNTTLSFKSLPVLKIEDKSICAGQSTSFDAGNTGGGLNTVATFAWSGLGTGTERTTPATIAGNYICTVTGFNGCTKSDTATLTLDALPVVKLANKTICEGDSTTFDAGSGFAKYTWYGLGIGNAQTSIAKAAGNYIIIVKNIQGCTGLTNATLTVNAAPIVNIGDKAICTGTIGSFDAGAGFSAYAWSGQGVGNAQTTTASTSGSYIVKVTDAFGCTAIDTSTLTINALPIVNMTNQSICEETSTTFDAGSGFSTYVWSGLGTGTAQTSEASLFGTYTVTVVNSNGCSTIASASLIKLISPFVSESDFGDRTICFESEGSSFDAQNPGATILWNINGITKNSQSILADEAGLYDLTVTGINGCVFHKSAVVTVLPELKAPIIPNQTICEGESTIFDAGAGFASYLWGGAGSGSAQTIQTNIAGNYSLKVSDAFGCSAFSSVKLTVNALPIVTLLDKSICEGTLSAFDAGPGFTSYAWSGLGTGTQQRTRAAAAGIYSVTVKGLNGCQSSSSAILKVNSLPIVQLSDKLICSNTTTTFDAGPGFASYFWSGLGTGSDQTTKASTAGAYTVTVMDTNFCTATASAELFLNNIVPVVNLGPDKTVCTGDNFILDAGRQLSNSASFIWNTGETTQAIPVNNGGTFIVKVTEKGGCTKSDTIKVNVNANTLFVLQDQTICEGDKTFFAGPIGSGLSYKWTGLFNGTSQLTSFVTEAGVYNLQVTNSKGCKTNASPKLTLLANPVVSLPTQVNCKGTPVIYDAGAGFELYDWSGPVNASSQTISTNISGDYTLTVLDKNNCHTTVSTTLGAEQIPPTADLGNNVILCKNESAKLRAPFITGNTYLWNTNETDNIISVGETGQFFVKVTNVAGCSASDTILVLKDDFVLPTIPNKTICEGTTTTFEAPAGFEFYTWSGLGTGTAQSTSASSAGTYTVKVRNGGGCDYTASTTLFLNPLPFITIDPAFTTLYSKSKGNVPLTFGLPIGGVYSGTGVSGGVFNTQTSGVGIHSIAYTFIDANGCINSRNNNIEVRATLVSVNEINSKVSVSPNPFNDVLNIKITDENISDLTYELCDAQGKTVAQGRINSSTESINTYSLIPGIYFLKIQGDKDQSVYKVVKN